MDSYLYVNINILSVYEWQYLEFNIRGNGNVKRQ